MRRYNLVNIYKDTIYHCTKLIAPADLKKGSISVTYNTTTLTKVLEPKYDSMTVEVINEDTFEAASKYVGVGNVVILNMASCYAAGGGVKKGAMAQEEELFRRSNYFLSLTDKFYPLNIGDTIYTPKVTVIKDKNYDVLPVPFTIAAIAAAALRKPTLTAKDKYYEKDYDAMVTIINNIFKVAYANNHEILILGALGCGAYGNPPAEVIQIFNDCLQKYWGCFGKIIFAVYSKSQYDVNYTMFKSGIQTKKI
jgi:uncharacterized protein (TIGR02452 family)